MNGQFAPTIAARRAAILHEARSWIGTPFAMGQSSKGYGVDCGLFLAACFRAGGIELPKTFGLFRHDWHLHTREERYLAIVEGHTRRVDTPSPGDIMIVRTHPKAPFSHSAIVEEWPVVIHAAWWRGSGAVTRLDTSRGPCARWETRFYTPFTS